MRIFTLSEDSPALEKTCPVCQEQFKPHDKVVLAAIQKPRKGYATVQALPVHETCYWVDD